MFRPFIPCSPSPATTAWRPALRRVLALPLLALALVLAAGCAALPAGVARQPSTALAATGGSLQRVAAASQHGAGDAAAATSGLRLLPNGDHALDARLVLIERAETSLDLQYYFVGHDDSALQLLRALRDAARRGVRVRLLVDDLHAGPVQPLLAGLAAQANAEVRLFNPLPARRGALASRVLGSLHEFERINHRMHNKLFIADGALAIAGGRNIGDEYFMRSALANFIDLDVLAAGPVVGELAAVFDAYWNSERAWPVLALPGHGDTAALRAGLDHALAAAAPGFEVTPMDRLGRPPLRAELDRGRLDLLAAPVRVLADRPDKRRCDAVPAADDTAGRDGADPACGPGAVDGLLAAMRAARRDLAITSPYFVPGEHGLAVLRDAAAAGVRVRLLTNSAGATDEPLVHWGYTRYRAALLQAGVQVRELSPELPRRTQAFGSFGRSAARLHAKVVVIDGRHVALGSANMDHRSARLNTELALLIDSPALAAELARLASADALAGSYRLRLGEAQRIEWMISDGEAEHAAADEPHLDWTERLRLGLLSLWIGEEQL